MHGKEKVGLVSNGPNPERMRHFLLTFLIFGFFAVAHAQNEKALSLMDQLSNWVSTRDDASMKWLKKEYGPWLLEGAWSAGQLDTILDATKKLKSAKLPFATAGMGYLESTRYLMETSDSVHWKPWHAVVVGMLDQRNWRKSLPNFLQVSRGLFEGGTIHDDGFQIWAMNGAVPTFEIDSLPLVRFNAGDLVGTGRGDRLTVENTSGVWNIEKDQF